MHYTLAPFIGQGTDRDPFRADIEVPGSMIDLRADLRSKLGWCLWGSHERPVNAPRRFYLGDDPNVKSSLLRDGLSSRLEINLISDSLYHILPEILTEHAKTDGSRWSPILSGNDNWYRVFAGGQELRSWPRVSGGATYNESFNKANSTTLGPNLTWSEIVGDLRVVGNRVRVDSLNNRSTARAQHDLSTANHYAEIVVPTLVSGDNITRYVSPMSRFSASAETAYLFRRRNQTLVTEHILLKVVSGVFTQLTTPAPELLALPETIRCSVDGSVVRGLINGAEKASITDTSIVSNLRSGIMMLVDTGGGAAQAEIDSFAASDLPVAPSSVSQNQLIV